MPEPDRVVRYMADKDICRAALTRPCEEHPNGRIAMLQEHGEHLRVVVDLLPEENLLQRLDAAFAEAKRAPDEDKLEEARRLLGE